MLARREICGWWAIRQEAVRIILVLEKRNKYGILKVNITIIND